MLTDSQSALSVDYSQVVDFRSSDITPYSVPTEDISSESFSRTLLGSRSPLEHEPDFTQIQAVLCGLVGGQMQERSPPRSRSKPSYPHSISLSEIEEWNNKPCLSTNAAARADRGSIDPVTSGGNDALPKREKAPAKMPPNKRRSKRHAVEDKAAHIRAKLAHSVVERRYRDNLNGKITELHRTLVATGDMSRLTGSPTPAFPASREQQVQTSKSDVMTYAMNYIHRSEVRFQQMADKIDNLNSQTRALEQIVRLQVAAMTN